jgi:hypothetical protein
MLPVTLELSRQAQLQAVKHLHERDLASGHREVSRTYALAQNYPNALAWDSNPCMDFVNLCRIWRSGKSLYSYPARGDGLNSSIGIVRSRLLVAGCGDLAGA